LCDILKLDLHLYARLWNSRVPNRNIDYSHSPWEWISELLFQCIDEYELTY
jgi:hypothetical protein